MDTLNYFMSPNDLPTQSDDNAYGPAEDGTYQVTSLFDGGDMPMAYAVYTGIVFIVSQSDNDDRVNLFLVPDDHQFGPDVRYYVYRGLTKSDFVVQNNSLIIIKDASDDDSDFIQNLRKGQNPSAALNLYDDLSDDYFINDLFYNTNYQFGQVTQGDSIGRFDSQSSYGFEIMLNEPFFIPTLEIARLSVNKIDTSNDDNVEVAKLQVLNYIDPAAYFGFFTHSQFSIGTNEENSTSDNKDSIYTNFINHFATSNTIYIDIRDENGWPIDWFVNGPTDIKLTLDGSSALSSEPIPYRGDDQFPLKMISDGFSNPQTTSDNQQYFQLTFSFPTDGIPDTPLLTLDNGYWLQSSVQIPDNTIHATLQDNTGWSQDIILISFAVESVQVANYIRLELGEYFNLTAIQNQIVSDDDYDNDQMENTDNYFYINGLFPFHTEGLPPYQTPQ